MFFPVHEFGNDGYFGNIHPRSKSQYETQKFLAGAVPWYGNWMRGRAQDEWTDNQLRVLGLSWSDIRSPWIAGLSGGNSAQATGNAMTSVSDNIRELYRSPGDAGPSIGQSRKAWQKEQDWKRRKYRR